MELARPLAVALSLLLAAASLAPHPAAAAPSVADLAKDRAAAAEKAYRASVAQHQVGRITLDSVYTWSVRWLEAELAVAPKTAKQALADHQKRMQDLEAAVQKMVAAGAASSLDADAAAYYRIEADLWAARAKR